MYSLSPFPYISHGVSRASVPHANWRIHFFCLKRAQVKSLIHLNKPTHEMTTSWDKGDDNKNNWTDRKSRTDMTHKLLVGKCWSRTKDWSHRGGQPWHLPQSTSYVSVLWCLRQGLISSGFAVSFVNTLLWSTSTYDLVTRMGFIWNGNETKTCSRY